MAGSSHPKAGVDYPQTYPGQPGLFGVPGAAGSSPGFISRLPGWIVRCTYAAQPESLQVFSQVTRQLAL